MPQSSKDESGSQTLLERRCTCKGGVEAGGAAVGVLVEEEFLGLDDGQDSVNGNEDVEGAPPRHVPVLELQSNIFSKGI